MRDWLIPPHFQYLRRIAAGKEARAEARWFVRDLVSWVVPAKLQAAALSAAYTLRGVDVLANAQLKGSHPGKRAFVIGNGPSLRDVQLDKLAGEVTIGANSLYKHPLASAADLKYLCIGDASFMTDEAKSVDWHRVVEEETPNATLLLHPDARKLIERYDLYHGRDVHYFHRGVTVGFPDLVEFDLQKPLNVGYTTGTMLSIPLAIYLGCTEIYLIGFDANWLDNFAGSYHFYETHEQFPEFDSSAADHRWPRYEDHLVSALRDFEAHRLIAGRAKQLGVSIYNATAGGQLDMYPRVDFESLF